jgi:hypothetical protein
MMEKMVCSHEAEAKRQEEELEGAGCTKGLGGLQEPLQGPSEGLPTTGGSGGRVGAGCAAWAL